MNLNQPTLVQFESERLSNKYIPPEKSNSFYTIGTGRINVFCIRANPMDYRFHLFTDEGHIYTGPGNFQISGDIEDIEKPYCDFTVIPDTVVSVNQRLTMNKGEMAVHGTLELMEGSQLVVNNGASLILYPDSTFIVNDNINIVVEKGSSIIIYGKINVHLSMVDTVINNDDITIDTAAVVNVGEIHLGDREYSMTDYDTELRGKIINPHTQGEHNSSNGRIGYTWVGGSPVRGSQILRLNILWGDIVLGDFKFSVLGSQVTEIENLQIIESLEIAKGTTLYISENYKDYRYICPELYLGRVIGNCDEPARCDVNGTIVVDGTNAVLTVDRGATLHINRGASVYLKNGGILRSTYNDPDDQVLFIDGTLVIDDISQITTFESNNIVFGEEGKIIISNPSELEPRVLFTTPVGIHDTDLYRMFEDRIDHIEYHISEGRGIAIDQFFDYYARDMINWYADRRIEKAIYDGLIVWHPGAFIELNHDIIPWVNMDCSLLHAARIFKSYGSYDEEKLQEVSERLRYAGCGNIVFHFVDGEDSKDITLVLDGVTVKSVVNKPLTSEYITESTADGSLFLRNLISDTSPSNIIKDESRTVELKQGQTTFELS